jgi:putative spermidine/putrescine transport system substrate-binding protein
MEAIKPIGQTFEQRHNAQIIWEAHAGGAAAIIAKIRATWPVVKYDVVAAWHPVFLTMRNEGWLEPVTEAEVPNLKDVPKDYIIKDDQGRWVTVPFGVASAFWGWRNDLLDKPFGSLEELLEPRFKGKICAPDPIMHTSLFLISLAMARGGNERNIEPGFEFVKELARRGNIGRVAHTELDFINSLTAGETAVSFWNGAGWNQVEKRFRTTVLTHTPGIKGYVWNTGWAILKGPRSGLAKKFANHTISPENNEVYNAKVSEVPANLRAKPGRSAARYFYKPEELAQHAHFPDFGHIMDQLNEWNRRWEAEVVPLIRRA